MENSPESVSTWTTAELEALVKTHKGLLAGSAIAINEQDYETAAGMLAHLAEVCAELAKRNGTDGPRL